jgi:hypothetical protein
MGWFIPLLCFMALLAVAGHVSDWLDSRAKGGRKAIKDLAAHQAFIDRLEGQARDFQHIDNFAAVTFSDIQAFRANPRKQINK